MKKILTLLIVVCIITCMLTGCGLDVPRPEIKTGEFDFSVTYEYGGEIKTISGVYVCEYDGIDWTPDGGYHREWTGYVKDGATEEVINLGTAEDGGIVELNLCFYPDHFMGDSYWEDDEPFAPCISVKIVDGVGLYFENDAELIDEAYGASIISYEYDEPIVNGFNTFTYYIKEELL